MPIDVQCNQCGKKLRAPDDQVGKKARCPQCKSEITIGPAPSQSATTSSAARQAGGQQASSSTVQMVAAPAGHGAGGSATQKKARSSTAIPVAKALVSPIAPAKAEWHVTTGDRQQFGPVTRAELDSWVVEGRLDANCQLLCEGWQTWKWAEEVYPQLATGASESPTVASMPAFGNTPAMPATVAAINPYAAPTSVDNQATHAAHDGTISKTTRRAMLDTRPWTIATAVVMFLLAGLMGLVGIGMLFAASALGMIAGIGAVFYLLYSALAGTAGYLALTYGQRIAAFQRAESLRSLEQALLAQKSFWKFMGIVLISFLTLSVLAGLIMGLGAASIGRRLQQPPSNFGPPIDDF